MRLLEWLFLLPLWRRVIPDEAWHVPAAIGTGIAWIVVIVIIAVASGGGDDDSGATIQDQGTPEPTITATPAPDATEAPAPTPEATPTPEPTPAPEPAGPASTFGSGTFIVGTEIEPGTYANSGSSIFCYWERMRGFGGTPDEIIANAVADTRQIVTISPTDAGFTSNDCGTWTLNPPAATASPTDPFGEGIYQVGVDIAAGTWVNDGVGVLCYWARLSGFGGDVSEIIATDNREGQHIVTIEADDSGFDSHDCGIWSKIE